MRSVILIIPNSSSNYWSKSTKIQITINNKYKVIESVYLQIFRNLNPNFLKISQILKEIIYKLQNRKLKFNLFQENENEINIKAHYKWITAIFLLIDFM
jgi:hypothetical protein